MVVGIGSTKKQDLALGSGESCGGLASRPDTAFCVTTATMPLRTTKCARTQVRRASLHFTSIAPQTSSHPSFSSASMQRLWILNDLYVAPEGRRHGVGRALLQAAREHAERTQAKGLELMTARDNYAAQALYESMGWQRDEVFLPYTLYF